MDDTNNTPSVSPPLSSSQSPPAEAPQAAPSSSGATPQETPAREPEKQTAQQTTPQYTKHDLPMLRQKASELKRTLSSVHQQKEQAFGKRKQLDGQITAIAHALKAAKEKRDSLTKEVKVQKQTRSKVSKDIQQKVEEIKKLSEERKQLLSKQKVHINPGMLKREIDQLEYNIETQGLSFTKEQELMKVIKDKKKLLNQAMQLGSSGGRVREIDSELRKLRDQAEGVHKSVQEKAGLSQLEHEILVKDAKQLRELRIERKKLNDDCTRLKDEFAKLQVALKPMLDALQKFGAEVAHDREEQHKHHEDKQKLSLSERAKRIEEKMMRGEKLTTEDLLVLQSQG